MSIVSARRRSRACRSPRSAGRALDPGIVTAGDRAGSNESGSGDGTRTCPRINTDAGTGTGSKQTRISRPRCSHHRYRRRRSRQPIRDRRRIVPKRVARQRGGGDGHGRGPYGSTARNGWMAAGDRGPVRLARGGGQGTATPSGRRFHRHANGGGQPLRARPEISAPLWPPMPPAGCVARRLHTPGMRAPRALPAGASTPRDGALISGRALTFASPSVSAGAVRSASVNA